MTIFCSLLEIEASSTDRPSVDPELRPLEPRLKKPPFSSWNTYKQLGSFSLTLQPMVMQSRQLVYGRIELVLREVTIVGIHKQRVSLQLIIDGLDGKRVIDTKVTSQAGDWQVIGRPLPRNRGQILALSCKCVL